MKSAAEAGTKHNPILKMAACGPPFSSMVIAAKTDRED
jgi:hypothetical protein